MHSIQPVVVTGLGSLTPLGLNVSQSWQALLAGKSGAAPITRFQAENFKTRFACELKDFSAADYLDHKTIRTSDRFTQYALIAAQEAWLDARLPAQGLSASGPDKAGINKRRCGVIWASGNGGVGTFEEEVRDYYLQDENSKGRQPLGRAPLSRTPRFNPYFIPKTLLDTPSGAIATTYGLQGVNFGTVSACASANTAIIEAMNYIRWGKADLIICGGSEAPITPAWLGGFSSLKALSTHNASPETASRPLDASRDGFVLGEGAGALVLESYAHARARGATIYGEVLGGGMSADAYHATATHPEGEGAALSMQAALEDAQLETSAIEYINLHATATPMGDLSEIRALQTVFGEQLPSMILGATKSMTGHLLGAAGAVEAIICIKALQSGMIPPTINTNTLDAALPENLNLSLGSQQQRAIKYAMSNNFGFGGHNATVVFGKHL